MSNDSVLRNNEILLRDYLFRFLRTPDYITDVNHYLPKYLTKDPAFSETQRVLSWEHERYRLKIIDFAKQFHPQTTTWGMSVWEEELGLPTNLNEDLEFRRAKVMAKLLGSSPMTVANTNKLVNLFTDDGKAYVDELPEDGTIKVIIPSNNVYMDELRKSLDEMLPAHLVYYFQRVIIIDGDDEEGTNPDSVADVNDDGKNSFFLHADFPISENIPYGKWYHAPKYDGSVHLLSPSNHNGALKYDGEIIYDGFNSDNSKYGDFCNWWFKPTGNSTYNKEYRHNGAILYDGLRPQEIEYDDGMDELKVFTLEHAYEEKVSNIVPYDGVKSYDSDVIADKTDLPTDTGGNVSILCSKRYNGKIRFNGDDINYFNGAIKADGNFTFVGGGAKALVDIITDEISGSLSYSRIQKETPLASYNPEVSDYVPITFDDHNIEITEETIVDNVETVKDDCGISAVTKGVRYNGKKRYNGGNINLFNGEILADGQFTYVGNGNQAKVEVVAIDLDESLSVQYPKKSVAPMYIENIDLVNFTYDKDHITVLEELKDYAEATDGNGELIIRQRARFNGNLLYRGGFEYTADGAQHFNGSLTYNNIYRVRADSDDHYNGIRRYGGRKNSEFIEYVSDISGNIKIIDGSDLERIPIATRTRLGFLVVGNNINVDDKGKITLPDNLITPSMTELKAGRLKAIFENRRL